MMKYFLAALLIFSYAIASAKTDKELQAVRLYKNVNYQFEYQCGNFISFGKGNIVVHTKYGYGGELTMKYRISRSLSYDLGFHVRSYRIDDAQFHQSLASYYGYYGNPAYYTSIHHYKKIVSLTQFGIAPSVTRIFDLNKFRLAPFLKINTSFFNYEIDSRVYVREMAKDNFYIYSFNNRKNQFSLMPAAGVRMSKEVTKLLSVCVYLECGYNVGRQFLSGFATDKLYSNTDYSLSITTPKAYVLAGAGIIFRPFNRVTENEPAYRDEKYLERFEKNR